MTTTKTTTIITTPIIIIATTIIATGTAGKYQYLNEIRCICRCALARASGCVCSQASRLKPSQACSRSVAMPRTNGKRRSTDCPSGLRERTDLRSVGQLDRWAEDEGVKWEWREGKAYFFFCQQCHLERWPADKRCRNRHAGPGTVPTCSTCRDPYDSQWNLARRAHMFTNYNAF